MHCAQRGSGSSLWKPRFSRDPDTTMFIGRIRRGRKAQVPPVLAGARGPRCDAGAPRAPCCRSSQSRIAHVTSIACPWLLQTYTPSGIIVKLQGTESRRYCVVSTLAITYEGTQRTVMHLHYTKWPDRGAWKSSDLPPCPGRPVVDMPCACACTVQACPSPRATSSIAWSTSDSTPRCPGPGPSCSTAAPASAGQGSSLALTCSWTRCAWRARFAGIRRERENANECRRITERHSGRTRTESEGEA